jgi:hypothetical protein
MASLPASAQPGGATPSAPDQPPGRRWPSSRRARIVATIVAAAVALGVVVGLATRGPSEPALQRGDVGAIASGVVDKAIEDLRSAPATSAVVYQQILPSLVQIETRSAESRGDGAGFGTGVIVNATGAILTAYHVVDGATTIRLAFVDGTRSIGRIVSTDPANDIAVLLPARPPTPIVPAVLGAPQLPAVSRCDGTMAPWARSTTTWPGSSPRRPPSSAPSTRGRSSSCRRRSRARVTACPRCGTAGSRS